MPVDAPAPNRRKRRALQEFGCGRYGCVYPTGDPSVVFKMTSDRAEAAFVVAAMSIGEWPAGMVRYHDIWQLDGVSYYNRPVYVLWRDEAENVGDLAGGISTRYQDKFGRGQCRDFVDELQYFQRIAHVARAKVQKSRNVRALLKRVDGLAPWAWEYYQRAAPQHLRGAEFIAVAKLQCSSLAQFMSGRHCGYLVGEALEFYLDKGLLLADVHLGNIGEVTPPDFSTWELGITDPGHMVPLAPRWLEVDVPLLENR
jgi:hypothetical protein